VRHKKKLFFLPVVWLVAGCHAAKPSPRPAPQPAPVVAAAPDAGPECVETPDLDRSIAVCEDAALRSLDPARPLLSAARMRRERMQHGEQDRPDDAQACAADARRSWSAHAQSTAEVAAADAEALYLDAVCSAAWSRMQGFTPLIERRAELGAALARVAQLAPDLDGAGADRELGALLAALPAYAGGDLAEARKHLETAVQRAPRDPRNRLALARLAVKSQDRALFEEQLKAAPESPDAQALLQREDDLFGR